MSFLSKLFGDPNEKFLSEAREIVKAINDLEPTFKAFSDTQLREKTTEYKTRLTAGETLDDLLPEAFATVREAAVRTIGQRHFDVQLIGGLALHRGKISEMRTGEGKTLTATLPLYLNALNGKGAHLVTVNDYLARLHASWMGKIFHSLGLTVGCTQQQMVSYVYDPEAKATAPSEPLPQSQGAEHEEIPVRTELGKFSVDMDRLRPVPRKDAYATDITYGTNNEFGFDYLRDNMVTAAVQMSQRGLYFAIVDEVDSILIDEARTPLIISAPAEESTDLYYRFADIVTTLQEGPDYNVDEKLRTATLTEEGIHKVEKALNVPNLYAEGGVQMVHHLEQALRARALFTLDKDYVVKDDEVIIVDEFTGRLMYGRRFSEGLHQAIEAKEKVKIQRESMTLATITFQNYFRLYEKLSGMTGTALTEAEEFSKIYRLDVVVIPTNRPMVRKDMADRVYKTSDAKWSAIVQEVKMRHEAGQPVLIGTVSIEKNEHLSRQLSLEGIPHAVLNAKRHEEEGRTIAQAGKKGAVTVATNMAGRGVDIILGGNPFDPIEAEAIKAFGGLHVIGTERHEARRIDNQLRGRAGRQGDPGSTQFFLSMEDDLMRIFGSDRMKGVMERLGLPDDVPIEHSMVSRSIESAQKKVEGHNFDIRKHLVEYDDVINKHREVIYRKRKEILDAEKPEGLVMPMLEEEITSLVSYHTTTQGEGDFNLDEVYESADSIVPFPIETRFAIDRITEGKEHDHDAGVRTAIIEHLMKHIRERFTALGDSVRTGMRASNPGLPAETDPFASIARALMLRAIDTIWIEHLDSMDHLRTGIGLRGYGQRDPLVEYKREAYRMFTELLSIIRKEIAYSIFKIAPAQALAERLGASRNQLILSGPAKEMQKGLSGLASEGGPKEATVTDAAHPDGHKVGRNDPCPCGSGKKYKKCHGA